MTSKSLYLSKRSFFFSRSVLSRFFKFQHKMGGIGAIAEPLVVVVLLFGGAWINRDFNPGLRRNTRDVRRFSEDDLEDGKDRKRETEGLLGSSDSSRSSSPSLLPDQEPQYRLRTLKAFGKEVQVTTPNTRRFKGYFLSRLLEKFPFLVECWYWFLIYWVSTTFQKIGIHANQNRCTNLDELPLQYG